MLSRILGCLLSFLIFDHIFCIRFSRYKYFFFMPTITAFAYSFWHASNYFDNGDGEIRTLDPLLARQVLSQLSYTPRQLSVICAASSSSLTISCLTMGLNGLEPSTSRLSGVRSNQLSYKPQFVSIFIYCFYI